jgi:hypothetical protein
VAKKDKAEKVTKSAKKAQKAAKDGTAKIVAEAPKPEPIRVSEFAVKNEKPEHGAQLDRLREDDLAAGMNEKSARVQRAGRVRLLNAGKTLPDHGGLMELNGAGALEVELTSAPPLPEGMLPGNEPEQTAGPDESKKERKARLKAEAAAAEQLAAEQAAAEAQAEAERQAALTAAEEAPKLSKKERKAAEKQLAKEQKAAATMFVPKAIPAGSTPTVDQLAGGVDISHTSSDIPELPKKGATVAKAAPVSRNALREALQAAQEQANRTGKKVPVTGPRQYANKNYGVRLQDQHIAEFPGLEVKDDTFDSDTQKWVNHFVVVPQS